MPGRLGPAYSRDVAATGLPADHFRGKLGHAAQRRALAARDSHEALDAVRLPVVEGFEGARQLATGIRLARADERTGCGHAARNSESRTAGMSVDPSEYMRSTWSSVTVRSSGSSTTHELALAADSHQHKPPQKRSLVAGRWGSGPSPGDPGSRQPPTPRVHVTNVVIRG
jgi:hypothetical protein